MVSQEYEKLVKTLLDSKLAASSSEAQRMAREMLNISEKVLNDSKKEPHYMVSNFKQTPETKKSEELLGTKKEDSISSNLDSSFALKQEVQQEPLEQATNISMSDSTTQSSSAYFPEENNSTKQNNNIFTSEAQNHNLQNRDDLVGQSENNKMTPEEYSAQKLAGSSLNDLTDDFLTLKNPPQEKRTEDLDSGWPTQQPFEDSSNSFEEQKEEIKSLNQAVDFSQKTSSSDETIINTYQDEVVEEHTREIKTERKPAEWTPEEQKLREQVDLSKVFNFSNN